MDISNAKSPCCLDVQRDEAIKAELLAYEKSQPSFNQPPQDESSNSDEGVCILCACGCAWYVLCLKAFPKIWSLFCAHRIF